MLRNNPQFILITMFVITLLAISANKNITRVKDLFVSVQSSGRVEGTSTVTQPSASASASVNQAAQASPSPSSTTVQMQTSPNPSSSSTNQSSTKTKVVVNGKEVTPDSNGNVTYHEESNGSNVDVKVSNSVNQQSYSSVRTENSINVNVNQD